MARTLSDYLTGKRNLPQPNGALATKVPVFVVLPAALAANDLVALLKIPSSVKVIDYDIFAPQLDSNGTPTLAFSIGVENAGGTDLATVYEAGLIFGRGASGSVSRCTSPAAAFDATVYTADRVISLKTTTVAATAALAGKTILVLLHLNG